MPLATIAHFPSTHQITHDIELLGPALFWSVAIVAATYLVSRLASGRLSQALSAGGLQLNVALILARTLWATIWVVGFILVLYQFGVGLTPLAAFIGVLGLAASLSLQSVLSNLVAGVYLLAERPFHIGDFIAVIGPGGANHQGRVEDIQMRTTHLRNRDNELILVPNSSIFGGVVTNRTAVGGFVEHLSVKFPRETEFETVQTTLLPMLQRLPAVLETPAPRLRLESMTREDWTACLSLWARSWEASSEAVGVIGEAYPSAEISGWSETA